MTSPCQAILAKLKAEHQEEVQGKNLEAEARRKFLDEWRIERGWPVWENSIYYSYENWEKRLCQDKP